MTQDPYFGLLLTLFVFYFSIIFLRYIKIPLLNPLILSLIIIIAILLITKIPYDNYYKGGDLLNLLITPATVALALPFYKTINLFKKHYKSILVSITISSSLVCASIVTMAYFLKLDMPIIRSIIPKSITTAIGIEVSAKLNGIISVTIIAIILTGNIGMIVAPYVFKIFKIEGSVARGIALGVSAHAIGTVKAMELGEVEGAMSGVAMTLTGIIVVFLAPLTIYIYQMIVGV